MTCKDPTKQNMATKKLHGEARYQAVQAPLGDEEATGHLPIKPPPRARPVVRDESVMTTQKME